MNKKVEILSPAGSYESLKAAIAAGADAVYIGGTRFGARAYANNLTEEELLEAIDYVHLHGRKIYLTINTLLKEHELSNELYDYLLPYYKQGIDAVIVQDIGVLSFIKEQFPELPIHASTQMTITNVLGAQFLQSLGVERVVTAREMQLSEIDEIAKNTDVEIESFVHGALCYCYSGQCLYSSLIGGRSGNRGQCAQPCRLPYRTDNQKDTQYVLSLKDICTLEYIPELVEAGIDSFKIEGRMKKPEYVALVTAMYRKYVDLYLKYGKRAFRVEEKDREMLMDLYNRGGSHGGYYHTKNGRDMLSLERPNHAGVPALQVKKCKGRNVTAKTLVDIHKGDVIELPDGTENFTFGIDVLKGQTTTFTTHKNQRFSQNHILNRTRNESLLQWIKTSIIDSKSKVKMNGRLTLSVKEAARLVIKYEDITVEVTGEKAQEALNQPMNAERVEKQMRKTGNTLFEFDNLEIELDGNLFIPMQGLNELRRAGIEALEKRILSGYRREEKQKVLHTTVSLETEKHISMYVYVEHLEQWGEALNFDCVKRIYLDCNALDKAWLNSDVSNIIQRTHQSGKQIYLGMPHIFREETIRNYDKAYTNIIEAEWDGLLIRNYESYAFLKNHRYTGNIVTDYNLYQFNRYAKEFWKNEKIESTTAPLELNFKELKEVGMENSELVVYGYFPMMISAQCVKKTTEGCKKEKGQVFIKDRYHKQFAVKNHCDYCYNIIYNTAPVVLTDQKVEIIELNPKAIRLHFTTENRQLMRRIMELYNEVFCEDGQAIEPDFEFTRGHFKRGIK
ncbi:MAG: U32 family peptidase [Faecalimonas sp.]|nr:U32 family peptidase [Faecalimonas sp.]